MRYIYFEDGLNSERDYPYTARTSSCKRKLYRKRYNLTSLRIPKGYSHDAFIAEL